MRISDWSSDVCSSDLKMTPEEIERGKRYAAAFTADSGAAVATAIAASPTRAGAYFVRFQPHRKTQFQHLGIGQARIGHVRLHHRGPGKAPVVRASHVDTQRTRAGAARASPVIMIARIAEGAVVHCSLACRQPAQAPK